MNAARKKTKAKERARRQRLEAEQRALRVQRYILGARERGIRARLDVEWFDDPLYDEGSYDEGVVSAVKDYAAALETAAENLARALAEFAARPEATGRVET